MAKKQPPKASALPAEAPKTPSDSKAVNGKQRPKLADQPATREVTVRASAREYSDKFIDECLQDAIDRVAGGEGLPAVAKDWGIQTPVLFRWLDRRADDYERARKERAHLLFERLQEVANEPVPSTATGAMDSAAVADKRLRVDTYKWMASKLLPKTYGDKLELDGKVELSVVDRLKALSSDNSLTHEALPGE